MLSWLRVGMISFLLCMLTACGIYILTLRNNLKILEQQNETNIAMLELKNVMLYRLEKDLKGLDIIIRERDIELSKIVESLDKAKELLGAYENEEELPADACAVLRSLGIVRKDGSSNRVHNSVQVDNGFRCTVTGDSCSGNEGNEAERLVKMGD